MNRVVCLGAIIGVGIVAKKSILMPALVEHWQGEGWIWLRRWSAPATAVCVRF